MGWPDGYEILPQFRAYARWIGRTDTSVLRALKRTAQAAICYKKPISIYDDMAHDPRYIPFLLGIGVRTISLDARYIQQIQECIMSINISSAEQVAGRLLQLQTITAIENELNTFFTK